MHTQNKAAFVQPVFVKHELLRDIPAKTSGVTHLGVGHLLRHRHDK